MVIWRDADHLPGSTHQAAMRWVITRTHPKHIRTLQSMASYESATFA